MKLTGAIVIFAAMFSLGCMNAKHTYQVTVKNDTAKPITVGLVKDAPPIEENWYSPEDVAFAHSRGGDDTGWGIVVPAGKTGSTAPLTGEFSAPGSAWLRVYAGELPLSDLLAVGKRSAGRLDIRLTEGANNFKVKTERDALTYTREPAATAESGK